LKTYEFNPVLDQEYMNSQYSSDLKFCVRLLELFKDNIPLELTQISEAAEMKDYESLAKLAHKIKPSFQMVGLTDMSNAFKDLEIKAKENDEESIKIYKKLNPEIDQSLSLIDKEIQNIKDYLLSL